MDAAILARLTDSLIDDLSPTTGPDDDPPHDRTLGELLSDPRQVLDEPDVLAVMVTAVRLRNIAEHLVASSVATAERLGIPARKRLKTGADLLTAIGVAPAAAYRAVRVGRAARTLPTVTRALRDGALGIEHADAIGKGLTHISDRVELDDDQRAEIITALKIQTTPAAIAHRAREIAITLAPAEPDDDRVPVAEDYDLNDMTLHQNDEGRIAAALDLDVVTGEELQAALDPLCRPVPLPDGTPDPRPPSRRRADALGQIIRTYLAGSERPSSGGVLPHVTLIRPARMWLPAATLTAIPEGSARPNDADTLGFTGPITAATADVLACDAALTDVLVDADDAPLDVGRTQRLFPPAIRRALTVRDRGCAFPGCGRPASWCDAHHIDHWEDGGSTCVDNGVLLCRMHHTLIHHTGWEVFLGPDRHPWFTPPLDPEHPRRHREPLRSQARRTMTDLPHAA